jgi:hypothetical protein
LWRSIAGRDLKHVDGPARRGSPGPCEAGHGPAMRPAGGVQTGGRAAGQQGSRAAGHSSRAGQVMVVVVYIARGYPGRYVPSRAPSVHGQLLAHQRRGERGEERARVSGMLLQ